MSHVVVGERLAGMNPEMVGHVVRGAGHFIEQGNGLVQDLARHLPEIPYIVARSLPDLTDPATWERWQWTALNTNYGNGAILAGSNNESNAWDRFMSDPRNSNSMDVLRELALGYGAAFTGDFASAAEHGADAIGKTVDGFLKDMGFNGGWGEGHGMWQPTGAGRDH